MAWAWIMVVCGCVLAGLGAAALWAGRGPKPLSPQAALGQLLLGVGLAADGVPTIASWPARVGFDIAGVSLVTVLLSCVLLIRGRPRRHREDDN